MASEYEKRPDGRVHATIVQVSYTEIGAVLGSGNVLDAELQKLQDRGCEIMNVSCYVTGTENRYVQAVIVYREP